MRRISIRNSEEWQAFDRTIVVLLIILAIVLLVVWFFNKDTLLFNCCEGDTDSQPVVEEQVEAEPEQPVVIAPPPVPPSEPTELGISIADGVVLLTGVVDSETSKQAIINQVQRTLPGATIDDQLKISEDVVPPTKIAALGKVLGKVTAEDRVSMVWGPRSVRVSGVVESEEQKQSVLDAAEDNGFSRGLYADINLIDQLTVAPRGPSCAEQLKAAQIEFSSGSAELTEAGKAALRQLVPCLQKDRYEVIGHTDSDGDEALNQTLSLSRAESAIAYLVSQGKPVSKFSADGAGETQPIATNATREGKARNRRIEFRAVE